MIYLPFVCTSVANCILRFFVAKHLMLKHPATWRAIGEPVPLNIFGSDGWKITKLVWSENVKLSWLYVTARHVDVLYFVVFVGTLFMGFDQSNE